MSARKPSPIEQGGARASKFGKRLENDVESQIQSCGVRKLDEKERRRFANGTAEARDLGPAWYTRNLKKFRNLYEVVFFADFFIYHEDRCPDGLLIEVKSQESPGSVDEKYVFNVMTLLKLKTMDTWLILEGEGPRPCAVTWMRAQATLKNRFRFMTYSQFRRNIYDLLAGASTPEPVPEPEETIPHWMT